MNYLREQNLDDEIFNKTAPTKEPLSDECNRRIKSELDSVFIDARNKYEEKKEYREAYACFLNATKNDREFKNMLLKRKAISSIKMGWKSKFNPRNWISSDKKKSLKAVEKTIRDIEYEKYFKCDYGQFFTTLFESEKSLKVTESEKNCIEQALNTETNKQENSECGQTLKNIKASITKKLHDKYSDKKRKVKKCLDMHFLNTEDHFKPFFKVYISNSKDESIHQSFKEEMLIVMSKAMTLCDK